MSDEPSAEIVEEDILRVLSENDGEATVESISDELISSSVHVAIDQLLQRGLVRREEQNLVLTEQGEEFAEDLLKKHLAVEKQFEKTQSNELAHEAAHHLEHQISLDVLEGMETVSSRQSERTSLKGFGPDEGLVADILVEDELFERLIAMGICPGRKIRVITELPNVIIVEIGGKQLAIEKDIAAQIEVVVG